MGRIPAIVPARSARPLRHERSSSAIPDLFTVLLILLITRFVVRLCQVMFQAVEEGRLSIPYAYPETAQSTRRLVTALIWLLGLVLAYPYLPGSNSDAFKGISVFLGVVLSLGSSGIVNQIMSGLTITYSRAVRVGDFVRIGDVEGTITQLGTLSTKVKTPRREEVTIPNAVVMGQVTTNYSRFADTEGVFVPTSLTIGYDTPWRQVQALLLLAAERTPGVRTEPKPVVRQTALAGFLHAVHAAGLPGDTAAAHPDARRAARQHPGRLQRIRRADHVAELRGRSRGPQDRAGGPVVCGSSRPCRSGGGRAVRR